MRYNHHQFLHQSVKLKNPIRGVCALIDVDYNKDDDDDDDNGNFVKIGNDTKGFGYDCKGGNDK